MSGASRKKNTIQKAFVLDSDNLGKKVVHGASFTFLGIFFRTIITFGSVAVLARILTPADFGYIAMATIITELAALFGNFGFSAVLIQRRVITRLQMDTVFWSSLFLGILLTTIVFILSFIGTWLFNEPIAGELLRVLCVMFIFDSLTVVHSALISRLMRFGTEFWIQIIKIVIRAGTAIGLAWNGFGVWSLVGGSLVSVGIETFLYVILVPYWPRFRFNYDYLVSTWKTNASYFGGGVLFYANSNIDLLLIGRAFGATKLGFYQNARSLTDEVRSRMAIPLQRVLFPAFSTLQNDMATLQAAVLKSGRLLSVIIFPVGLGVAAVANDLVPILYGKQWFAMIPVVKFLGVSIAIKGCTALATPIFNSQNRVGLGLRHNIIGTIIIIVFISIASSYSIETVALAVVLATLYAVVIYWRALGLIGLGWRALGSMILPPALAAGVMWGTIELSRLYLIDWLLALGYWFPGIGFSLAWHVFLGVLVYPLFLILIAPSILNDVKSVVQKFRPNEMNKAAT